MKSKRPRKLDAMHLFFGKYDGHTCGECTNFVTVRYHDKMLRKCRAYGLTHSEASDWAKRWTACGLFGRGNKMRPVIEWPYVDVSEAEAQVDGQTKMEM